MLAREQTIGQYDKVDPIIRDWFQHYFNDNTQRSCCGEADCHILSEEEWGIEDGNYFILIPIFENNGLRPRKYIVPAKSVVTTRGNPTKKGIACWNYINGEPNIICFTPGILV